MPDSPSQKNLAEIAARTRYPLDAFHFVRRGLDYAVHRIHKNPEDMPEPDRHVTGQQLTAGLREFAIEQYGQLALPMLRRWNIHRTEDFGRIVFAMVEGGLMQATERDSIRDFDDGFDFDQSFQSPIPVEDIPLDEALPGIVEHG